MSRTAPAVLLHGAFDQPTELTVAQLRELPAQQVSASFNCRSRGAMQQHNFEGPRLWDVLRTAGTQVDRGTRKVRLRHLLTVTGADDHFALLSWAEIDPDFSGRQILLATSVDGVPLDETGPQLVVPGDTCGARYVSGITTVWVGLARLDPAAAAAVPAAAAADAALAEAAQPRVPSTTDVNCLLGPGARVLCPVGPAVGG
ncbi:molybdopterin-dependent oxidoreductase [Streptacidiphilus sp. N1-3]|uniref:Molybdopterin-dependent oxidoreductase n=1 Tax=Streptacidiphilus alkalitolerans TaxID=3342712 RepID=A0ABV6WVT2_9ACTN